MGFAGALTIVILLFTKRDYDSIVFVTKYKWVIGMVNIAAAVDEIILAGSLLYILWQEKSVAIKT